MTSDLRTQVRDYTEFFVSTVDAVEPGEISVRPIGIGEGAVRPIASAHTSNRHRGWFVAVAVAAAVLVLIGGATLLLKVSEPDAPTATTPSQDPSSLAWFRVDEYQMNFEEGGSEQQMLSVTAGGPGLVTVGGVDSDAAVWTSQNGVNWSRVPHDDAVFGEAQMKSVTVGGPGLVAVGLDWVSDARYQEVSTPDSVAVWTSPDGITWSRVPYDGEAFGGFVMTGVVVGGPGLVAVGYDGHPHGETRPVVWTSPDGLAWSRVPLNDEVFAGDHVGISSVIAADPGLVAVGWDGTGAAVWTSPDGITWSRGADGGVFLGGEDSQMNSVTAGGPGLVAVGSDGTGAAVWTSPDGITWSRTPHDEAVFGGGSDRPPLELSAVTAGSPGLVAVGSDGTSAAVWTSPDGITWSRTPHGEAVFGAGPDRPGLTMTSITAGGPGLVVVGQNETWGNTEAVIWVATADG